MSFKILSPKAIEESYDRIKNHIEHTRITRSQELDDITGHRIYFKLDCEQLFGSFKTRGVLNALLELKERGDNPDKIVAFSTGNHAKAISCVSEKLGFKAIVVMPEYVRLSKRLAISNNNTEVIITKTRQEAEDLVEKIAIEGAYLIPPSDHNMVIAGNGTVCYEALRQIKIIPDAIFAPCGGGGLVSGCYLAKRLFSNKIKLFAAEPSSGNDAHISVKQGHIFRFKNSPNTIADGARTLGISSRVFHYLKQIDGFYDISEEEIIKCMIDIKKMLGIICEPTSALALAACYKWLSNQKSKKEVLVIITGKNIDMQDYNQMIS